MTSGARFIVPLTSEYRMWGLLLHEGIEEIVELVVFDKESVVAEWRMDFAVDGAGDFRTQFLHLARRKHYVGLQSDDECAGLDASEGCVESAAAAPYVVGIESVQDGIVGIGVEASAEFFALILLVAARAVYFRELLGVALREIVAVIAAVAEQTDCAGGGESLASALRVGSAEGRVGLDAHAHCLVDGYGPGSGHGVGGHKDEAVEALGLHDGPLDSLESAYGTADESRDVADAEGVGQDAVGVDYIAYGVGREILIIWLAGGGILVEWRRGAVGRAENVGADDEIVRGVEKFSLLDGMGPPVLHVAVGCERVAYPDDVAFILVKCTVSVVGYPEPVELSPKFKGKRLVVVIIIDHFSVSDTIAARKVTHFPPGGNKSGPETNFSEHHVVFVEHFERVI